MKSLTYCILPVLAVTLTLSACSSQPNSNDLMQSNLAIAALQPEKEVNDYVLILPVPGEVSDAAIAIRSQLISLIKDTGKTPTTDPGMIKLAQACIQSSATTCENLPVKTIIQAKITDTSAHGFFKEGFKDKDIYGLKVSKNNRCRFYVTVAANFEIYKKLPTGIKLADVIAASGKAEISVDMADRACPVNNTAITPAVTSAVKRMLYQKKGYGYLIQNHLNVEGLVIEYKKDAKDDKKNYFRLSRSWPLVNALKESNVIIYRRSQSKRGKAIKRTEIARGDLVVLEDKKGRTSTWVLITDKAKADKIQRNDLAAVHFTSACEGTCKDNLTDAESFMVGALQESFNVIELDLAEKQRLREEAALQKSYEAQQALYVSNQASYAEPDPALSVSAMAPGNEPVPTYTSQQVVLPQDVDLCAKQGEFCSFKGSAVVYYGMGENWVSKTYTNGVACNNDSFGVPQIGEINYCVLEPNVSR